MATTIMNTRPTFADRFGRALTDFAPFSGLAAFARQCRGLLRLSKAQLAARNRIAHHVLARDKGVD